MERTSRFGLRAAGVVTVAVVALFAVLFYAGSLASGHSAAGPTVDRALTIAYDPAKATYSYSTTNLQIPLGSTVRFTITSYDPSPVGSVPDASALQVSGTVGGTITVQEAGSTMVVHDLAPASVAHTFTMSSGYYHLNVPIPAAPSADSPVVVSFTVTFPDPGSFAWGCVLPCGPDDMTEMGTMFGSVLVS